MKFLVPYLIVALLGTAGVYYGIQPLWQRMGWPLPASASTPATTATASTPPDPYLRPAIPKSSASTSSKPAATTPTLTRVSEATGSNMLPPADTSGRPEASAGETVAAAPAANPDLPPLTPGSKTWGMTISGVSYYALSGENRGKLAGGAIMDIMGNLNTSKGDMSMGQVERNGKMAGPYLVANGDLVRFNVARSETPTDTIALLKQYYQLKEKLDLRLAELKKQAVSANPYAAAYGEAVKNYHNFDTRVKQLTSQRDAATGAERMKLMDQLRGMMPESQRLLRAVDDTKAKYNQWKNANPSAMAVDTSHDPQALELLRQIAALEPQVKAVVQ